MVKKGEIEENENEEKKKSLDSNLKSQNPENNIGTRGKTKLSDTNSPLNMFSSQMKNDDKNRENRQISLNFKHMTEREKGKNEDMFPSHFNTNNRMIIQNNQSNNIMANNLNINLQMNNNQSNFINPNIRNTMINNQNLNISGSYGFKSKEEKIILKPNFEKLLNEKLNKYGLNLKQNSYNDIVNTLNNGLDIYLKNLLEKLIIISRARNVNLNLYSKLSEKNPTFKIKTYNAEKSLVIPQNYENQSYKDFSIIFSKNMKSILNNLEQFEELNSCKMKYEKISSFRNKIEEINQAKEREKEKQTGNKQTSNVVTGHVRTRPNKSHTTLMKNYKNICAKTQKKDEMDRQKKDIKHTLEAVLDTKIRYKETSSVNRMDTEMVSNMNESNILETYTKMSEISKSENPAIINGDTNEIQLNIYKNYLPSDNPKFSNWIKRRITLKDLIFYLEGEKRTPCHSLLLHRAIMKLNHLSNNY